MLRDLAPADRDEMRRLSKEILDDETDTHAADAAVAAAAEVLRAAETAAVVGKLGAISGTHAGVSTEVAIGDASRKNKGAKIIVIEERATGRVASCVSFQKWIGTDDLPLRASAHHSAVPPQVRLLCVRKCRRRSAALPCAAHDAAHGQDVPTLHRLLALDVSDETACDACVNETACDACVSASEDVPTLHRLECV